MKQQLPSTELPSTELPTAELPTTELPTQARAAVFSAPNQPFSLLSFPLRAVRPGEILVRVTLTTICGSDLHSFCGARPSPVPGILGHEIVGRVAALGSGIDRDMRGQPLRVGDRITWSLFAAPVDPYFQQSLDLPQKSRGLRKYGHEGSTDDPHLLGGFAEYCYLLPGTSILRLPDDVDDVEAAPLNCGIATMAAVLEAANITGGERVVIFGAGLLGLYGAAMARTRGAVHIIVIDPVSARRAMALQFGADQGLDPTSLPAPSLIAEVHQSCPPDGADVVLEVCGIPDVVPMAVRMLRTGGRLMLAGMVSPGAQFTLDGNDLVRRLLTVRGIHNYHPRHLVEGLAFLQATRTQYPFRQLVPETYGLEQVDAAFARACQHGMPRVAVDPTLPKALS